MPTNTSSARSHGLWLSSSALLRLLCACAALTGSRPAAAAPLPGGLEPPSLPLRNEPLPPGEQTELSTRFSAWLNATHEAGDATCGAVRGTLAACDSDAGTCANYTSLRLNGTDGCCSRACANVLDAALVAPGPACYRAFLVSLCSNTTAAPVANTSLAAALFGTIQRCLGVNATTCDALSLDDAALARELTAAVARNNATATAAASTAAAAPPPTQGSIVYAAQAPDPSVLVPSTPVPGGIPLADPDEIAVVEASPAPLTGARGIVGAAPRRR